MANEQLRKLAKKLPPRFIGDNGRGMEAADHTVMTQLLLQIVGPYKFELVEKFYSGTKKNKEAHLLTGAMMRLSCKVDGQDMVVEEAGGLENGDNEDGDGERMKKITSDALKRCCMRMGLGLHIWADGGKRSMYFLDKSLEKAAEGDDAGAAKVVEEAASKIPDEEPKDEPRQSSENGNKRRAEQQAGNSEPEPIMPAQKHKITELATEIYGALEDLEEKKGVKVAGLTHDEAKAWIKGLESVRHRRMQQAREQMAGMKGAATNGAGK